MTDDETLQLNVLKELEYDLKIDAAASASRRRVA